MDIEFEATNSFCYRFARYVALPEIMKQPEVASGEEFHLITVARRVIDNHLTAAQLNEKFTRKKSGELASIGHTIRFYIPFLAKNLGILIGLGAGIYRLPSTDDISDEVLEEAELEGEGTAEDQNLEDGAAGSIYAYSFPLIMKAGPPFPIKIGRATGSVGERVAFQVRKTASFENAKILATWQVKRVVATEYAIHNILKSRGRWRSQAPGTEWFDTTIDELNSIVDFIEEK